MEQDPATNCSLHKGRNSNQNFLVLPTFGCCILLLLVPKMVLTLALVVFLGAATVRPRIHESGFGSKGTEIDPFWVVVYTNPLKTST